MGSRAVVVVCRDADVAAERFGMPGGDLGAVYTRTGRPFFADAALAAGFLERVRAALAGAGFWQQHDTGWVCLDAEIMPWSNKAQALLQAQYAAVGSASRHALAHAVEALEQASARTPEVGALPNLAALADLLDRYRGRQQSAEAFVRAYRRYCWPVDQLDDLKLAPFHVLATEGRVHTDRDHVWHMEQIACVCEQDPALLRATPYRLVDLSDPAAEAAGIEWWHALTDAGGEGMVVKPLSWLVKGKRGLVQPAIKCRGREYLRIIYGPEYTAPEHLSRLRARGLSVKRSLALRELALGLEALHRFVDREPLYRVHECVFGVLALESEPVDPRL